MRKAWSDFLGALLDQIGNGTAPFRQQLFSPSAKGFDDLRQGRERLGSQLTIFRKRPVKPKACGNAGLSDKGRWQGDLVFHCDGRSHCKKVLQGNRASSAKILAFLWGMSRREPTGTLALLSALRPGRLGFRLGAFLPFQMGRPAAWARGA